MLPGFRSLFIAVVLSVSMLIFGLGAAALLRATHEEFASLPLKQMPEVTFAARREAEPTLAVLQVDTPAADLDPREAKASEIKAPEINDFRNQGSRNSRNQNAPNRYLANGRDAGDRGCPRLPQNRCGQSRGTHSAAFG